MKSNSINPFGLIAPYYEYCDDYNYKPSDKVWSKFLNFCGLEHNNMFNKIKIIDEHKWFLAKIKYGI